MTTEMIGRFATPEAAKKFVLAGDAYFTVRSLKTGVRYTFRVATAEPSEKNNWKKDMYFVSYLGGPDNTADYWYMGTIRDGIFRLTLRSKVNETSTVTLAFRWVYDALVKGAFPRETEIWHEGRCGVCGRPLTVPESIESGIGPVCAGRVA